MARRRTVGLSSSASMTAGRPPGSPMAPSAATAASRHRTSSCARAVAASAPTAPATRRSARNQAAPTTTRGSGSARLSSSRSYRVEREPRPRTERAASVARRRTATGPVVSAWAMSGDGERAQAGQRAERSRLHLGIGVTEPLACPFVLSGVPGGDHVTPPERGGAALRRGFHGRIIAHRIEYGRHGHERRRGGCGHPLTSGGRRARRARRATPTPTLAHRPRRRPRGARGGGGHPQPVERRLLRAHAGRRHAGGLVHHGAGRARPSAHRHHPPHRRLRDPAERPDLPAGAVLLLGRHGVLGGRAHRLRHPGEPVHRPGLSCR